ncbi:STAS/SEC14 domain-containing protein [Pseudarthrobacter defluvii]|uniref:STAS/SEC14 domain-containing protein n=1 Tax=Pseudarthrobacter defluvii TaxID=410837 RepID=UPI003F9D803B
MIQVVNSPECTVSLAGDIVRVRWFPGVRVSRQAAMDCLAAVTSMGECNRVLMLVDLTGVAGLDRGARTVFAQEKLTRKVAVIGATPVDEIIANYFIALDSGPSPIRYFTNTSDAEAWLRACPLEAPHSY